jgi:hypothetical protein
VLARFASDPRRIISLEGPEAMRMSEVAEIGDHVAAEDHARRACYAALALQEDLRRYANELRLAKSART